MVGLQGGPKAHNQKKIQGVQRKKKVERGAIWRRLILCSPKMRDPPAVAAAARPPLRSHARAPISPIPAHWSPEEREAVAIADIELALQERHAQQFMQPAAGPYQGPTGHSRGFLKEWKGERDAAKEYLDKRQDAARLAAQKPQKRTVLSAYDNAARNRDMWLKEEVKMRAKAERHSILHSADYDERAAARALERCELCKTMVARAEVEMREVQEYVSTYPPASLKLAQHELDHAGVEVLLGKRRFEQVRGADLRQRVLDDKEEQYMLERPHKGQFTKASQWSPVARQILRIGGASGAERDGRWRREAPPRPAEVAERAIAHDTALLCETGHFSPEDARETVEKLHLAEATRWTKVAAEAITKSQLSIGRALESVARRVREEKNRVDRVAVEEAQRKAAAEETQWGPAPETPSPFDPADPFLQLKLGHLGSSCTLPPPLRDPDAPKLFPGFARSYDDDDDDDHRLEALAEQVKVPYDQAVEGNRKLLNAPMPIVSGDLLHSQVDELVAQDDRGASCASERVNVFGHALFESDKRVDASLVVRCSFGAGKKRQLRPLEEQYKAECRMYVVALTPMRLGQHKLAYGDALAYNASTKVCVGPIEDGEPAVWITFVVAPKNVDERATLSAKLDV